MEKVIRKAANQKVKIRVKRKAWAEWIASGG
jgi:hypothetical protein